MSEKSKKSVEPLIVLITGASGSGKTSVAQVLEQKFSKETTSLYYFDDIGVPSTTKMIEDHGSGEKWQQWATARWIERIYNMDKEVIFLEGSFYPEFAVNKIKDLLITNTKFFTAKSDPVTAAITNASCLSNGVSRDNNSINRLDELSCAAASTKLSCTKHTISE